MDNASRRVLAWTLETTCKAAATEELLRAASKSLPVGRPKVMVLTDGGSENAAVGRDPFASLLVRVRAQVDVAYSNSMIENLWHQAKHRWLYLHELDSADTVRRLFGQFVDDHNSLIPRAALSGRTPDEVFFGREVDVPVRLTEASSRARAERVRINQAAASCGGCDGPHASTPRGEVVDCR